MSFVTPIQHNIPSSNNYKNVNITNFKGTSYSDNLFDKNSSGCSDSENVYINEENILAVRPRLKHVSDFENISEIKQVNVLSENSMVYYIKDINGNFKIILSDKDTAGVQDGEDSVITVENDLGKCSFFKDADNKIICVSEIGLFEIVDKTHLLPINSENKNIYTPTLKVGMTLGNEFSGTATGESKNRLNKIAYNDYQYSLKYLNTLPKDYIETRKFDTSKIIQTNSDIDITKYEGLYETDYDIANVLGYNVRTDQKHQQGYIISSNVLYNSVVQKWDLINNRVLWDMNTWESFKQTNYDFLQSPAISVPWNINNIIEYKDKHYGINDIEFEDRRISPTNYDIRLRVTCSDSISNRWLSIIINLDDESYTEFYTNLINIDNKKYIDIITKLKDGKLISVILINIYGIGLYTIPIVIDMEQLVSSSIHVSFDHETVMLKLNSIDNKTIVIDDVHIDDDYNIFLLLGKQKLTQTIEDNGYTIKSEWFNILKINVYDNLMKFWFEDFQKSPEPVIKNVPSPKLHFANINNKKLLCFVGDSRRGLDVSEIPLNVSNEVFLLDTLKETVKRISDDSFTSSGFYTLKNTTSFLGIKIQDDKCIIRLYSNYKQNSGNFKIKEFEIEDVELGDIHLSDYLRLIIDDDKVILSHTEYQKSQYSITWSFSPNNGFSITYDADIKSIKEVVETTSEENFKFTNHKILDNRIWLYGDVEHPNKLIWSDTTSAFYWPEDYEMKLGSEEPITNVVPLSTNSLGVFQKHNTTVLLEDDNNMYSRQKTLKTPKGCLGEDQVVVMPTTNYPLVINDESISILTQSDNNVVEDSVFTVITEDIFKKFSAIKNKELIKTHVHEYYIYFYWSDDGINTKIWCLDCRTLSWFKWTLPINVKFMYESNEQISDGVETDTRLVTNDSEYVLTNSGIMIEGSDDSIFNEETSAYVDNLGANKYSRIFWFWKSRIQTLGTVNYLKKIVSLQLIFSDKQKYNKEGIFTSTNNIYYSIKTYRKKSELLDGYVSSNIDGVGIKRIKIRLPKCDFAEIMLSNFEQGVENNTKLTSNIVLTDESMINIQEELDINNIYDRLHLIGITLKILLSEGLNG